MKVLVLNCGSSSVKFQLIETNSKAIENGTEKCLAKGKIERIGKQDSWITYEPDGSPKSKETKPVENHSAAIAEMIKLLTSSDKGVIKDIKEIGAVGHRTVHGGEEFSASVLWNDKVLSTVEACCKLAPLHNPHNITGYKAAKEILKDVPHAAVFDTAFHHTIPPVAFLYGLPYKFYTEDKIRRYGFHGTSHRYVSNRVEYLLGKPMKELNIITIHLGNGSSIAAVKYGESVDTTMGFTPLEGLIMGTRCGDMDPSIPLFIMKTKNLTVDQVDDLMNKKSGLLGISELSNDMLDLENAMYAGNQQAKLAMDAFCYRIKKYIGSYSAVMNGVDVIVFTGGIGENATEVREWSCSNLERLGIKIDKEKNKELNRSEGIISTPDSKVTVMVIPTNEELLIARDTIKLIE
jgi:acetate kinase